MKSLATLLLLAVAAGGCDELLNGLGDADGGSEDAGGEYSGGCMTGCEALDACELCIPDDAGDCLDVAGCIAWCAEDESQLSVPAQCEVPTVDPPPDGPRTASGVCARWRAEWQTVEPEWVGEDPSSCELGEVPADAQANGIRRTNLFRWLAGLEPVTVAPEWLADQQACALIQLGMNDLDHSPPSSAACYSDGGAEAAGSSNLAMGSGLADSVDLYVADVGVETLGHRRWVLNPAMGRTTFGYKSGFSCMYSVDRSRENNVEFVAWPPPGFLPVEVGVGPFSVQLHDASAGPAFSIEVAMGDGAFEPVSFQTLDPFYGDQAAYTYDPPGGDAAWTPGQRLRVALRGLEDRADIEFAFEFTSCD